MKACLFIVGFVAVATATKSHKFDYQPNKDYTLPRLYENVKNQTHKAFEKKSPTVAYFVPLPENLETDKYIDYDVDKEMWYYLLLDFGYVPIFNKSSELVGFYTETPADSVEYTSASKYDSRNFVYLGLLPLHNSDYKVVAAYS